jgi:hypothetical protein
MTPAELQAEHSYRLSERIGISCGDKEPTMQEMMMARLTVAKDMASIEAHEAKVRDCEEAVKGWLA